MENKYKIIKLTSGESLICKINKVKQETIILERPMVFKSIQLPNSPIFLGAEALQLKNWMEFSEDKTVEIPINHITALMKADSMISHCYNMEKEKEDNPELKQKELNDLFTQIKSINQIPPPALPPTDQTGIPKKLNINFNVPEDMIPDVMGALGINMGNDNEFMNDEEMVEDAPEFPPNNSNSSKENWGNDWKDWPADPHDYI